MEEWADYGITAVRYNPEQTHILRVKAHETKGDTIGIAVEQTRSEVVAAIERGKSFVTILRGADNKRKKGRMFTSSQSTE